MEHRWLRDHPKVQEIKNYSVINQTPAIHVYFDLTEVKQLEEVELRLCPNLQMLVFTATQPAASQGHTLCVLPLSASMEITMEMLSCMYADVTACTPEGTEGGVAVCTPEGTEGVAVCTPEGTEGGVAVCTEGGVAVCTPMGTEGGVAACTTMSTEGDVVVQKELSEPSVSKRRLVLALVDGEGVVVYQNLYQGLHPPHT